MNETDKKINVLFVMMQMKMGGSERLVHSLVSKLDRNIYNPSLAWFYGDDIMREFKGLDVPLHHVPKVNRVDFTTMRTLGEIITDNDIHVVNSHHFMSMVYSFYGCKIKNRVKLIYTEHSEWEIEQIAWKWKTIGKYLLNHVDAAVGVTQQVSKRLEQTFTGDGLKTITIQNGVDLGVFEKDHGNTDLRKKIGLATNEKVIVTVANLKKIKNQISLLRAFKELIKDYDNVRLLLIGQGFKDDNANAEPELKKYVHENGLNTKVLFLGYRSDVPDLLALADIFCLTSYKEGLPISLIEAMAAGLPVVGTDVEGIRGVIVPQKNGYLIRTDDLEGLKNILITLLSEDQLRHELGRESRALAKEHYSFVKCINQYQDLFYSIVKNGCVSRAI